MKSKVKEIRCLKLAINTILIINNLSSNASVMILHGIIDTVLRHCLTEFEFQFHDYVHIRTNNAGKSMNFLYPLPIVAKSFLIQ